MTAEDDNNLYHPDTGAATHTAAAQHPRHQTISWTAAEYLEHRRGASWYALLFVVTVAFAAILFLVTKDYFATAIIIVLGVIVAIYAQRKPQKIDFELTNSTIKVGSRTYGYALFKSFSVLREGGHTSLSFMPIKRFMPPVSAYFDPKDEAKITALVGEHLPYEERQPSAVDRLTFRLRL